MKVAGCEERPAAFDCGRHIIERHIRNDRTTLDLSVVLLVRIGIGVRDEVDRQHAYHQRW